jgi:hypothetical protein
MYLRSDQRQFSATKAGVMYLRSDGIECQMVFSRNPISGVSFLRSDE